MLHHVGAEQVAVGQIVQRAVEGQTQHQQRSRERRDPSPRRLEPPQLDVEPAQEDEPYDHARVQVPALPAHPAPAAPRSVKAPSTRNSSATITPAARQNRAPNKNLNTLLSACRA